MGSGSEAGSQEVTPSPRRAANPETTAPDSGGTSTPANCRQRRSPGRRERDVNTAPGPQAADLKRKKCL